MERTALRLATCAALLNGGTGPPWPTVAGEFIYDSIIDTLVDVMPSRRQPVIIVRTDADHHVYKGFAWATRQCTLLIELGVLTAATTKINGVDEAKVDYPRTDSQLEAFLDMLEWQLYVALFGYTEWAQWWQHVAAPSGYQSTPRFSAPERGAVRLAVRNITLLSALGRDCRVNPVKEFDAPADPVLPPLWSEVTECILKSGGGAFRQSVVEMTKVVTTHGLMKRPTYPPLQRVWAVVQEGDNIEAMWPIEQEAPLTSQPIRTVPPTFGSPTAGHG